MTARWSLVLMFVAGAAVAKPPVAAYQKALTEGQRCYEQLNYGCAITKLREARPLIPDEPALRDVRIQVQQSLGFALANVERHDEAVTEFKALLALKPDATLDPTSVSPKVYRAFEKARRAVLAGTLVGKLRPVPLPDLYVVPSPTLADLALVEGRGQRVAEAPLNAGEVWIGGRMLFGADKERFAGGFGVGIRYGRVVYRWLEVEAMLQFFSHPYALGDALPGRATNLFDLQASIGLRAAFSIRNAVELSVGLGGGLGAYGVGGVSDGLGGSLVVSASALWTPMPALGFGLVMMPTWTFGNDAKGEPSTSLSLPIMVRTSIRF